MRSDASRSKIEQWIEKVLNTRRAMVRGSVSPLQPSTILWLAARALEGRDRMVSWAEARQPLGDVLVAVGASRNPQYPLIAFSRSGVLEHDGLPLPLPTAHGSVGQDLNDLDPYFGLPEEIEEALRGDPGTFTQLLDALERSFASPDELRLASAACGLQITKEQLPDGGALRNIPGRVRRTSYRFPRRVSVADAVKAYYDHTCQRCAVRLLTPGGPVAEAAHVQALGDKGPDEMCNLLCLCPNDHRTLDKGGWFLTDDVEAVQFDDQMPRALQLLRHHLDPQVLVAHREAHGIGELPVR